MKYKTILKSMIVNLIIFSPINAKDYYKQYNSKSYDSQYNTPYYAENNSYYGETSRKTYRPKNNYVQEYNHKDGSRVRSHYRSRKNK